jgi:hypothetical protein
VISSSRIGKLTLWTSGEAQLALASVESGEVDDEYREITSNAELTDATGTLVAWIHGASDLLP